MSGLSQRQSAFLSRACSIHSTRLDRISSLANKCSTFPLARTAYRPKARTSTNLYAEVIHRRPSRAAPDWQAHNFSESEEPYRENCQAGIITILGKSGQSRNAVNAACRLELVYPRDDFCQVIHLRTALIRISGSSNWMCPSYCG